MSRFCAPFLAALPSIALAALAALALGALSGCGTLPTAPVAPSARLAGAATTEAGSPSLMPVDPGLGGPSDADPGATPPGSMALATDILTGFSSGPAAGTVTTASATLGPAGGTLVNGRWRLVVPANALATSARFTLAAAGRRGAACQVQVDPTVTNSAAWTLSVDCRAMSTSRIADLVLLSYDLAGGTWTEIAGSGPDQRRHAVSAAIAGPGIFGVGTPSGAPAW